MGLGDVVALALGGYAFVARFVLARDRMARWDGYEMLFVCGVAGMPLLVPTWLIAYCTSNTVCWWPANVPVLTVACVLGVPVGFLLATACNRFWPGIEQRRLRGLRALAESNSDSIEVLLDDAMRGDWYVELALETGSATWGCRCVMLHTYIPCEWPLQRVLCTIARLRSVVLGPVSPYWSEEADSVQRFRGAATTPSRTARSNR